MHRSSYALLLVQFLSALLLGVPLLRAQSDDARLEAVQDFRKYYRTFKEVDQKVEAIMTLRGNECVPAAQELMQLLINKSEKIRTAAMAVISTFKAVETFQQMIDGLADMADNTSRALIIEVLGRAGIQQSLPVLHEIGMGKKGLDVHVKVKIAEALGRLKDNQTNNDVLARFLEDPDPLVRIAAADTVGKLKIRAIGDGLVPLLNDKYWQVQAAAIEACGKARVEKAIDGLIELMRLDGRFKTDTAEALFLITMKDFGVDPDQWAKSIGQLRGLGWHMPTDADVVKALATRKKNDEYYGKKSGRKTFGGIVTTSTRVLFIIDVSGSMEDHVVEKEKFDAGYENLQKLTIVKSELINTIDSLDRNTYFNVVAFATNLKLWKKDLVGANVVSKASAKAFVKRLQPLGGSGASEMATVGLSSNLSEGRTNTFKALMYPFNIDPDKEVQAVFTGGVSRELVKKKLDTVFFLTDGRPSVGKYVDTELILKEVEKVNKVYRMTLHTIAIGGDQLEFLRTLAMQNGGEYVHLGR
jgi:hypothetical protein